ncbi:phospholipase A and acyltransferase 4-like [Sebastes umbrosus]|uniref:phospholipase A and acyltransferase 4-like n=1 Tax=Sebastes umbrosus TaxID=72105 RepID=UPI00189FE0C2|nr:phospholipase A and acyltransferase 4-like [Sebastes umbrosus]
MDYEQQVEQINSTAKLGDLIEFSYPIGYSHWAVYDEDKHVFHFAVADEGKLMNNVRTAIQALLPVCGDLLIGMTKIRRMPLREVTVPKGVHILISNNRHAFTPSASEDMRRRRDALLGQDFQYHLLDLNCEHFATFVRYGKAVCNQIPTRSKNVECEEATATFEGIVSSKATAPDSGDWSNAAEDDAPSLFFGAQQGGQNIQTGYWF